MTRDERKTKAELLQELHRLRERVSGLKQAVEEWSKIFDVTSDLVFIQDKDFKFVKVNKSVCGVLEVKLEDLIGKKCYEVFHKSDKPWPNCPSAKTLKDKRPHTEEIYDPNIGMPLLISTSPLLDENGELTGVVHIAKDITERKKAEETLKREKERAEQYLNIAEVGMVIVNPDENISLMNKKGCKILGYKQEELIGKNWFDILVPQRIRSKVRGVFRKLMAGDIEAVEYYENPLLTKDGDERLIAFHNTVMRDLNGKVTGTLCSAEDITERKQTEEALQESEERLRVALSAAQMGTWRWDPVTNQDTRDASLNLILGLEAVESTQPVEDFLHFVHPEDRDMTNEEIQRAIRERRTYVAEFRILRADGTVRWLRDQGKPICDENDRVLFLTGAVVDITEHKKAEEEIRNLSSAVEQSIDGIAIGDLEPKLVYVNHAFARMHGYTIREMLGMSATKLHKEQIDEYERALEQLKTRGSWEGELGHTRKDNTTFPTYMSITLLKNDDGEAKGTLAVARDITKSKLRERELNLYRERMAGTERLVSVGALSATLAHELNQPLTVIRLSIQNALEDLQMTSCPGTTIEQLNLGLKGISNIISIVGRFKNFARSSPGKTVKEVDLNAVAQNVMRLLNEKAWHARTSLHVQGLRGLPFIFMDEKDLEQLFFAIIQNAIQAGDGKEKHFVIVSGKLWNQHIELRFFDNCGGIAPENLNRIFEPFFTTKPVGEGTGLGLCIVQRIVSENGGKIHIETKHGEGTTFMVTLPVKRL